MASQALPRFRQPFVDPRNGAVVRDAHDPGEHPWAAAELRMCGLSADIRDSEEDWAQRRHEPAFIAHWRAEGAVRHLDEDQVDYVLSELDDHASLRDVRTGIETSCFDRIWQSDTLVSDDTTRILCLWIRERIAESDPFTNPKWPEQVYDLVHPSLYSWVAGRTILLSEPTMQPNRTHSNATLPDATSRTFAWIATDYSVSPFPNQRPRAVSSGYINNIPLDHHRFRGAVDNVVADFIPLFERVLSDSTICRPPQRRLPYSLDHRTTSLPSYRLVVSPSSSHLLYQAGRGISLAGRDIQVYLKLSLIHLTPGNHHFSGGDWHYEGMRNEHIVACGVYCVEESNVTELQVDFRAKVDLPVHLNTEQLARASALWGIAPDGPTNQELPSTVLPSGRSIAFPNIYQHRVGGFSLLDPTRPGYRVVLSVLLVDPNVRVLSTSQVHPQQPEAACQMRGCSRRNTFTRREAQLFREQLEDERDNFAGVTQRAWVDERWTIAEDDMDSDMD
ncbi:hypothetical protein EXIGLDRAFT_106939 [Exidia glandulosa HHB12029]|uniref:DUF4246 domain-containing protein n=1 Tax=Exidia glandulosa HHB12029 TaxID=1314781 RepID=A0A165GSV7_EXIGL|nr:hypothetical protein EXIGLDRAFT_106939 [Exidia glandulosa HHB12029]